MPSYIVTRVYLRRAACQIHTRTRVRKRVARERRRVRRLAKISYRLDQVRSHDQWLWHVLRREAQQNFVRLRTRLVQAHIAHHRVRRLAVDAHVVVA